jgi:pimeloyl-ACP methyl ester carboxylesterase
VLPKGFHGHSKDAMAHLPHFTTLGHGPAVLLLHDADGGHLSFAPQVETLASLGYRAIAWDMPGYGYSVPVEPYGFKGLAQSCLALAEALRCERVTLVGHGMGAMVALEAALRDPRRVERLVLCAGGPPLDEAARQAWVQPRLAALAEGRSMEEIADRIVPQQIGSGALPEGVKLAHHAMAQVHRAVYRRALEALPVFDRDAATLAHMHAPTLLISGAQDRCTPPEALQALAQVLPDARHVGLPAVGHWPQLEDPEGFDSLLLDFLAQQRCLH